MSSIVVQTFVTMDGVAQAPGGSDEDRADGFEYGGWQFTFDEPEVGELVGEWESKTEALLLGRRTYEIFANSWGVWDENADDPEASLTKLYNRVPKYVASRTLTEPLAWKNSHLLGDDVPAAVQRLKDEPEVGEIRVWGSTVLIKSLAEHDLVDEYRLVVYPLTLGTGKRLFSDGFPMTRFALAESRALPGGIVVNTYRRSAG